VSILIVDDDPDHRWLIEDIIHLSARAGQVRQADTAEQALSMMRCEPSWRPDLLLVDLELPGMNGLELIDRIRNDSTLCNLPVVMITGSGDVQASKHLALQAGADGFLAKATLVETIEGIRSLLQRFTPPDTTATLQTTGGAHD
jgi:DNA-binding response OmpR family regulator